MPFRESWRIGHALLINLNYFTEGDIGRKKGLLAEFAVLGSTNTQNPGFPIFLSFMGYFPWKRSGGQKSTNAQSSRFPVNQDIQRKVRPISQIPLEDGRVLCVSLLCCLSLIPLHWFVIQVSPYLPMKNITMPQIFRNVVQCSIAQEGLASESPKETMTRSATVPRSGCSTESKLLGTQLGQIQMMSFLQQSCLDLSAKVGFVLYSFFLFVCYAFIYIWGLVFLLAHWYI